MHGNLAYSYSATVPSQSGAAGLCAAARRVLSAATEVPDDRIFALTRLEDIISDSLVMEVVILELEEFLGCEADRRALSRLETVDDLARWMLSAKAQTRI